MSEPDPGLPIDYHGPRRSEHEEAWNAITHGLGCIVSMGAAVPLCRLSWARGDQLLNASVMAYCLSLIAVYLVSSLSHAVQNLSLRRRLRIWDQGLIYLLIVSTYTPMAIVFLRGAWHAITVCMWLLALYGFLSKVLMTQRVENIAVRLYVLIGWLPLLAVPQLISCAPWPVVTLIVAGGLAYTGGVVILRFDHRARFMHTAWHCFVLLGSALHYLAVLISLAG